MSRFSAVANHSSVAKRMDAWLDEEVRLMSLSLVPLFLLFVFFDDDDAVVPPAVAVDVVVIVESLSAKPLRWFLC